MMVREPAVAGMFYPADDASCRRQLRELVPQDIDVATLPPVVYGAIAPHAGWAFSGRVCGAVLAAIAARTRPGTIVLFGAAHRRAGQYAALFSSGAWQTPLGLVHVDSRLADRILAATSLIEADPYPHEAEHSIEVQIPFVQYVFPEAKILPVLVEPSCKAVEIGQTVARTAQAAGVDVVYLGSSDLTHYGPHYGFMPKGAGQEGLAWAKQVNDRRLIDVIRQMRADAVVQEVAEHSNACGAGAIAATMAACQAHGARQGVLLAHVSSAEVAREAFGQASTDAVGYAGIVFG